MKAIETQMREKVRGYIDFQKPMHGPHMENLWLTAVGLVTAVGWRIDMATISVNHDAPRTYKLGTGWEEGDHRGQYLFEIVSIMI